MTCADVWRPESRRRALFYDLACVMGGVGFLAMAAQAAVPVPFSPVPVTGQTLAVLLVGALLGPRRAGLCLMAYLAEGAAGWPVFAGGMAGPAVLTGPTGGYLIGFLPAACLTGWLAERGWDRKPIRTAAAMAAGNGVIYAFGLPWLSRFVPEGGLLAAGLLPFLSGDLLKLALASALLPYGWRLLGRKGKRGG
jgi:biotin transport system substrate-specific component